MDRLHPVTFGRSRRKNDSRSSSAWRLGCRSTREISAPESFRPDRAFDSSGQGAGYVARLGTVAMDSSHSWPNDV